MSTERLKPCPFCGDTEPTLKETANARDTGPVYIHCDACGADGPQCDYDEAAVTNWNRRCHELEPPRTNRRTP